MRTCSGCGTPLRGRRSHGFPTEKGGVVCGRSEGQRTVVRNVLDERTGELFPRRLLETVETPECRPWLP